MPLKTTALYSSLSVVLLALLLLLARILQRLQCLSLFKVTGQLSSTSMITPS